MEILKNGKSPFKVKRHGSSAKSPVKLSFFGSLSTRVDKNSPRRSSIGGKTNLGLSPESESKVITKFMDSGIKRSVVLSEPPTRLDTGLVSLEVDPRAADNPTEADSMANQ